MKNLFKIAGVVLLTMLFTNLSVSLLASPNPEEQGWPKKIENDKGKIIIYQPQIESFTGERLEARAAVSVTTPEITSPVFGAMWFDCRVSTDKDERTVDLVDLTISAAKFPESNEEDVDRLIAFLEREVPTYDIHISLDRLLADLEMDESGTTVAPDYNNTAPEIIYSTKPAVLVYIDGDPIMKESDVKGLQYVVNTPFFIALDTKIGEYYIKGREHWFSSRDPKSGWTHIENPPKDVSKLAEKNMPKEKPLEGVEKDNPDESMSNVIPEIYVRTTPAELLQSDGDAEYLPIEETTLLYMNNTDSDIIMDIRTQEYYVLISGRWYKSSDLTSNDWTFINPDALPGEFEKIPSESDLAFIKASVAGTQEAKEAVLENDIPQTAEVNRADASLEVAYDGDPQYDYVEGTQMKYAVNTDKSVLLIDKQYYCCDNAIWFVSNSASGPWEVCVDVPDEVQDIPPESPVYNVKYVYVYDYTPTVVYIGYTPGYVYSYSYMGCVYYGTGYYYNPWYGHYYYPRPVTYGFGVHYNPYTGWGFSMTASRGWFSVSIHSGGYWGPAGYRHGYNRGYYNGYRHGYNHGAAAGYRAGYNQAQRNNASNNVYKNRANGVTRTGGQTYNPKTGQQLARDTRQANTTGSRPQKTNAANNVYTDKSGNVYKKDGSNWQKQEGGKWQNASTNDIKNVDRSNKQTRDATKQPNQNIDRSNKQTKPAQQPGQNINKPNQQPANNTRQQQPKQNINRSNNQGSTYDNLNRDAQSRNRGTQRSNNYQQNKSSYQYSAPANRGGGSGGGASRGGGGRRR